MKYVNKSQIIVINLTAEIEMCKSEFESVI